MLSDEALLHPAAIPPHRIPLHMESAFQIGLRSARALAAPAAILIAGGVALVVAYHRVPAVAGVFAHVAELKAEYGYAFSFALNFLLAGVLPWVFRMTLPGLRPAKPVPELVFGTLWWGGFAVVVDALYRALGHAFDGRGWPVAGVIAAKLAVDLCLFMPLFAAPVISLVHLWKDAGYDFSKLRAGMSAGWYRRLVLPNLIPNHMVWIPGATLVFCMPGHLQLPLSSLIACFWALMCLQISARTQGRIRVENEEA